MAKSFKEDLQSKLSNTYFPLNVDEATNNNSDQILNILVQYYDDNTGKLSVEHFGSREQNLATAKNIFSDINDVLNDYGLKWDQVISILMDNCSTMRGTRGGVETLCRQENAYLLDISGDTVHMINNAAKAMFRCIDDSIENMCSDIIL